MTRTTRLVLLASLAIPLAFTADTGSFDVLTFNVAGLPSILSGNDVPGDKETNSRTIGSKFAEYDYDFIHVQEVCTVQLPWFLHILTACRTSTIMHISTKQMTTHTGPQHLVGSRLGAV